MSQKKSAIHIFRY